MNYYSKQRMQILDILKATHNHPTAQELYNMVHQKYTNISKSTVYRNINILVNNGVVLKISVIGKPDKYDYIRKNHHHAICTLCGHAFDFEYNFNKQEIIYQLQKQTPIVASLDCITIEGICRNCKSKTKEL